MSAAPETHTSPWQDQPAVRATQRRAVRCLAAAQIVGGVGIGVASALGPLLAEAVAHDEALAGVARTATTVGAAAAGVPLALLAKRRGRRTALSTGWLASAVGGLVLVAAAVLASIPILVAGMLLFGIGSATNQQSRYAAADLATPHRRARALSIVIWSTTIGAVIGPNLAGPGAGIAAALHLPRLTGAFLLATVCMIAGSFLLRVWLRPDPLLLAREHTLLQQRSDDDFPAAGAAGRARSDQRQSPAGGMRTVWLHLRHTPRAAFAFLTVVVANTVMGAVMTMTPVSMSIHGAALTVVGITISGHLLGMYAFAPVVGWLSDTFGTLAVAVAGQAVFLASTLSSGLSHGSVPWMMVGLFLLGLGWSFSLVAGSAMLTEATPTHLHPSVQGTADSADEHRRRSGSRTSGPSHGHDRVRRTQRSRRRSGSTRPHLQHLLGQRQKSSHRRSRWAPLTGSPFRAVGTYDGRGGGPHFSADVRQGATAAPPRRRSVRMMHQMA